MNMNREYWSPSRLVKTKRLNIILLLATTINKVYTITLVLTVLLTRMMTLANILILKNYVDVMSEVCSVVRDRGSYILICRC